jgi:uncharacterized protein involved in response to NO
VACSAWWAITVIALWRGNSSQAALQPFALHGLLMVFGFMPFFINGFLFTVVPKWLQVGPRSVISLCPGLGAQLAGWLLAFFGARASDGRHASIALGAGLAVVALGSTAIWLKLLALVRESRNRDRRHAIAFAALGGVGAATIWIAAIGACMSVPVLIEAATRVSAWTFVGGTFVTAAHRMVPFLGDSALPRLDHRYPEWLLWSLIGLLGAEGLADALGVMRSDLAAQVATPRAIAELASGAALSVQAVLWLCRLPLRIRMIAMLYTGFAWLAVSFVLSGLTHWSPGGNANSWSAAPLHAFTMGFLGSIFLAMVSRIICAQTGRTLVADTLLWKLFQLLQVAIVLRIGASLAARVASDLYWPLIIASASVWCLTWVIWAVRHVPWLAAGAKDRRPD